jgi:phosphoribosylformylglycinamidine synthase II
MAGFEFQNPGLLPRPSLIDDSGDSAFLALLKKHKISADEYGKIKAILGRAPTMSELGVFSAMWSEHCSYKSSRVHLKRFPTHGPSVVVGPGENAGVVRLSGKLCAVFKMESHNHPSYIEPYQGAATGVGGILRDVFCMGARPIANLNALRFGARSHTRTSYLVENVVKGIGDYGNCIGVPTVGGNISFDDSYNGNCLVNAMTIGTIHEDRIFKGYASGTGNLVVYVGSATGRDGIHGATMASDSFGSAETSERSTVQVGDPFTEKLLLEATLDVLEHGLVVGLQDMGAAGLTSSSFEMAGRAGNGLYMDLDQVPVRATAMTAYELLLSESQERMLMVVKPDDWARLRTVLDRWQLSVAVIGAVTDTGRVQIHHKGQLEVDVPVAPMTDEAPKYERPMRARLRNPEHTSRKAFDAKVTATIKSHGTHGTATLLHSILRDTGDKSPVYLQYDRHIGGRTVHASDDQGAAVLWLRSEWAEASEPWLGLVTAAACNERYCREEPRLGAAHAVTKAARMIAAAGGEPLAITDCLNYGNPEDPHVMWEFSEGVDGISTACQELGTPVVSGNVSLYNETDGVSIAPTPMIGMVGRIADVRQSPKAVAENPGKIYLLLPNDAKPTFGGSLAAKLLGFKPHAGEIPLLHWDTERESMSFLRQLVRSHAVSVARDVGDGGILTTACKMALPHGFGLGLDVTHLPGWAETDGDLSALGEIAGAYLVVLKEESAQQALQDSHSLRYNRLVEIGTILASRNVSWNGVSISVEDSIHAYKAALTR